MFETPKREIIDTFSTDYDLLGASTLGLFYIHEYLNGKSLNFKNGLYHSKTPIFKSKSFCEFLHPVSHISTEGHPFLPS